MRFSGAYVRAVSRPVPIESSCMQLLRSYICSLKTLSHPCESASSHSSPPGRNTTGAIPTWSAVCERRPLGCCGVGAPRAADALRCTLMA